MKIHGKDYMEVKDRVKIFREKYPNGQIITNIEKIDSEMIVMKTTIINDGLELATGFAAEVKSSNMVNETSHIENCETSSVGRAVAFATAIGIETSIASASEVINAINQQASSPVQNNKYEDNNEFENDDSIIWFGKHKGKRWEDLPDSYLDWLAKQDKEKNPKSVELAQHEVQRRLSESDRGDNMDHTEELEDMPF